MRKEGYWLNAATGVFFKIDEHARWITDRSNAKRIGLAPRLYETGARSRGLREHPGQKVP